MKRPPTDDELELIMFDSVVSLVNETDPRISPVATLMIRSRGLAILKSVRRLQSKVEEDLGPAAINCTIRSLELSVAYLKKLEQLKLADPAFRKKLHTFLFCEHLSPEEASNLIDEVTRRKASGK